MKRIVEFDEEKAFVRLSEPCRITALPQTEIQGKPSRGLSLIAMDNMERNEQADIRRLRESN